MTNYSDGQSLFLYKKLTEVNEKITSLSVKDLEKPEIPYIIEEAKNLLKIYKKDFSKEFKKEHNLDTKKLEDMIKDVEKSIELLKK